MDSIQLFNTSKKGPNRFKEMSDWVLRTLNKLQSIRKRIKGKIHTSVNITKRLNYKRTQDSQKESNNRLLNNHYMNQRYDSLHISSKMDQTTCSTPNE